MSNLDETPADMQMDEDHDEGSDSGSPPNLRNLPLELYPKIASCLDYVSDDLFNFCTSLRDRAPGTEGNGEIVDKILGGNEDYLLHIVASTDTRSTEAVTNAKAKILQWMGSNPNWTERCVETRHFSKSFCRFSIHHSNYAKLNLHQYQPGVISFQGYVGKKYIGELPREGNLLHSFSDGLLAAEWTMDEINGIISKVDTSRSPGWTHHFVFLKDANFIFSHPIAAIAFGLEPVLRHMLGSGVVNIWHQYSFVGTKGWWFPRGGTFPDRREDRGLPLLYHTVTWSPDISCFQYLMTVQDIHSTFWANGDNVIDWCVESIKEFSLGALEIALRHPRAPGINDLHRDGGTALGLLCSTRGIPLKLRHEKLKMLLAYNADPNIGYPLPINSLRQLFDKQIQNATECQKLLYNEMVDLLNGESKIEAS